MCSILLQQACLPSIQDDFERLRRGSNFNFRVVLRVHEVWMAIRNEHDDSLVYVLLKGML